MVQSRFKNFTWQWFLGLPRYSVADWSHRQSTQTKKNKWKKSVLKWAHKASEIRKCDSNIFFSLPDDNFSRRCVETVLLGHVFRAESVDEGAHLTRETRVPNGYGSIPRPTVWSCKIRDKCSLYFVLFPEIMRDIWSFWGTCFVLRCNFEAEFLCWRWIEKPLAMLVKVSGPQVIRLKGISRHGTGDAACNMVNLVGINVV